MTGRTRNKPDDYGWPYATMARYYPANTPDNTDLRQMNALLENLPRLLEMEAGYNAAALAKILGKMLGG